MTRVPLVVLFGAVLCITSAGARADLPVAPKPREVRPDGTRDPVPKAEPAKAEHPADTVKRIIENSKDVGDKLAQTDTGADTQKKQGKILSDIDSLINQQENPPPPPNQDKKDDKQDKKDMPDMNDMGKGMGTPMTDPGMGKKDGMPEDKMGMGDPMRNPGSGTGDPPPGGSNNGERKPRMGEPKSDNKKEPGAGAKEPSKPDNDPKKGEQPKEKNGKDPAGAAGGNPMGKAGPGKPALPFDDDVAKDVWGHLPDKLRQQMSQYYKEDFTPKYAELLKLYYSSLSDKGMKK
jgi:hypothetical protein